MGYLRYQKTQKKFILTRSKSWLNITLKGISWRKNWSKNAKGTEVISVSVAMTKITSLSALLSPVKVMYTLFMSKQYSDILLTNQVSFQNIVFNSTAIVKFVSLASVSDWHDMIAITLLRECFARLVYYIQRVMTKLDVQVSRTPVLVYIQV